MKRYILILLIIIILVPLCMFISHTNNSKNLKYALEFHVTKSLFNKNKLQNIDNFIIKYSDDHIAVVNITGTSANTSKNLFSKSIFNLRN